MEILFISNSISRLINGVFLGQVLSSRLGRKPEDIIKLDANENPYGVLFIYARGMSYSYMPLYFRVGVFGFVKDVISNIYLVFKRFEDEEKSVFIAGTVLNVKPFIPK